MKTNKEAGFCKRRYAAAGQLLLIFSRIVIATGQDVTLDPAFKPAVVLYIRSGQEPAVPVAGEVAAIALQGDGKLIIGGRFDGVNGVDRSHLARLNRDGSLDTSLSAEFEGTNHADAVLGPHVQCVALQSDGKLVIAGEFAVVNGSSRKGIARLLPDGSVDLQFDPGSGVNGNVIALMVQDDGKIVLGGTFNQVNNSPREAMARLNPDGSLDAAFKPSVHGFTAWILPSVGKYVVGGGYIGTDGTRRYGIARLNADGSLDIPLITPEPMFVGLLDSAVQSDGKVLVTGVLPLSIGARPARFARLNPEGGFDLSFNPDVGSFGELYSLAVQRDDKVVVAGLIPGKAGPSASHIVRFNADGSTDTRFTSGQGVRGTVWTFVFEDDGGVLIGGRFSVVNDQPRFGLARFKLAQAFTRPLLTASNLAREKSFILSFVSEVGPTYRVETTIDLVRWSVLTNVAGTGAPLFINDAEAGSIPQRFYRVSLINP